MKKLLFALLSLLLLSACGGKGSKGEAALDIQEIASNLLKDARMKLAACDYNGARECIMRIRSEYPTAIEARKQGILLLDSIEMFAARDSVRFAEDAEEWERLDVKAKFYERKLEEDKKR